MKIYTKTGDGGTTAIFGGKRISKSDPQVEAYGAVDELTSVIGLAGAVLSDQNDQSVLIVIQKNLYQIMVFLSGAKINLGFCTKATEEIEKMIDQIESQLPKLTHFVLSWGSESSCRLHLARTVCRRAERRIVNYLKTDSVIIPYINRLSDLFFVMARKYNKKETIVSLI